MLCYVASFSPEVSIITEIDFILLVQNMFEVNIWSVMLMTSSDQVLKMLSYNLFIFGRL